LLLKKYKGSSLIYTALLKYGLASPTKFKVEILKYCSPAKCLKWEQFFLDLFKPEYNILKIAGAQAPSLGSKRSPLRKLFGRSQHA